MFVGISISVWHYFYVPFCRLSELLIGTVISILAWGRRRLLCLIAIHIQILYGRTEPDHYLFQVMYATVDRDPLPSACFGANV